MHINQTLNSLVIENPEVLPFPEEIKQYVSIYKWDDVIWNTMGLPAQGCAFSLLNGQLFLDEDESGNASVQKIEDFTGTVIATVVMTPDKCEDVFALSFKLSFLNGLLAKAEREDMTRGSRADYDAGFKRFIEENERQFKIRKSWWFRYLYVPYYYVISGIVWIVVFPAECVLKLFMFLMSKLVPIRP